MFCFACQDLLHSFYCKALLLFEQIWNICQGGCSDIMISFLPSLKKSAQIYSFDVYFHRDLSEICHKIPEDFLAWRRPSVFTSVGGAVLSKTLLLLSVQDGCDDRQQNWELFLKCSKCLQAGHWGSWKLCVSGVEMQGVAEGAWDGSRNTVLPILSSWVVTCPILVKEALEIP